MIIGLDYWRVCSHFPDYFRDLSARFMYQMGGPFGEYYSNEVHIISAIGKNRTGTVQKEIERLNIPCTAVHEVVFKHPSESPILKTDKAIELGVTIFYDDRQDVCDEMARNGILAFRVPRIHSNLNDLQAEIV